MTATNIGLIIDAGCHFPPRFLGELMAIHPSTNQPTNQEFHTDLVEILFPQSIPCIIHVFELLVSIVVSNSSICILCSIYNHI
jgi:hypothetical protein